MTDHEPAPRSPASVPLPLTPIVLDISSPSSPPPDPETTLSADDLDEFKLKSHPSDSSIASSFRAHQQDTTVVEPEDHDSLLDSNGRVLYPPSKLDMKPPPPVISTPQPWDLVDPPEENNAGLGQDGQARERKFSTLRSGTAPSLIPKSSYYFGPPPSTSAYNTPPVGHIGLHHPREILRVERDYTGGELIQFAPIYPLELEGRITPTQFLESINAINELLISAHSIGHAFWDNFLAITTLQISRFVGLKTHYDKEMLRLQDLFDELNAEVYNPVGLNLLWPRNVAFLFMEIEYY